MARSFLRASLGTLLLAAGTTGGLVRAEEGLVEPASYSAMEAGPIAGEFENVSNSSNCNRWEATAALLYLQPVSDNMQYGTLVTPLPAPSPHWVNQAAETSLSPAFNVGVRYIVPENGNDVRVS